jgi:Tfp pilus assembly protein PilO
MALPVIEGVELASRELNRNALVVMVILLVGAVVFEGYVIWIQDQRLNEERKEKEKIVADQYHQNLMLSIKLADAERSMREAAQNKKR